MDKRGLLTFALCAAVLFFYYTFIYPILFPSPSRGKAPSQPPSSPSQEHAGESRIAGPATSPAASPAATPRTAPSAAPSAPEPSPAKLPPPAKPKADVPIQDHIVVETDLYHTVWTNRGAALKSLALKKYKSLDRKSDLELLKPFRDPSKAASEKSPDRSLLALDLHSLVLGDLEAEYGLERAVYQVHVAETAKQVRFSTRLCFGADQTQSIEVTKTFTLADGQYHIDAAVEVANLSKKGIAPFYTFSAGTGIVAEDMTRPRLEAIAGRLRGQKEIEVSRESMAKLAKKRRVSVVPGESWGIRWAGVADKYFAAALVAEKHTVKQVGQAVLWGATDDAKLVELMKDPQLPEKKARAMAANVGAGLRMTMREIAPGQSEVQRFKFFVGPKSRTVLAKYPELERIPAYGWFGSISRLLGAIMAGCYAVIPNYGVAIIILTLIVRICLHPLSRKSQISMHKMQKLQPKMTEIKERHKSNKRKQSEEQMKLFREHGVNPMSGCFPMLLQLPIFIALYRGIDLYIELRQAPFVLWIQDLSRPDTLCRLPFMLPIVRDSLNILPIVMTITFLIQQRMMPKSADPQQQQQQKMMMFMPLVFGVILYHMPSGLTLYWLTSTLLGIVEQKLIKAHVAKMA